MDDRTFYCATESNQGTCLFRKILWYGKGEWFFLVDSFDRTGMEKRLLARLKWMLYDFVRQKFVGYQINPQM